MLTCPICLDPIVDDKMTTRCKHSFHKQCIAKWHRNTCPVCREPMDHVIVLMQRVGKAITGALHLTVHLRLLYLISLLYFATCKHAVWVVLMCAINSRQSIINNMVNSMKVYARMATFYYLWLMISQLTGYAPAMGICAVLYRLYPASWGKIPRLLFLCGMYINILIIFFETWGMLAEKIGHGKILVILSVDIADYLLNIATGR
jgi:hypothetical protein